MASPLLNLQDPAATQTYAIDYTALLAAGETVTAAPWTVTPAGPVISAQTLATPVAGCDLAGVVLGGVYRLINTATTSTGRVLIQSLTVRAFPQ